MMMNFNNHVINYVPNSEISILNILKIIRLKRQFWKYNYISQYRWIRSNLKANDIHCMLFDSTMLIGYVCLVQDEIKINGRTERCIILSNVIVDKYIRGKGISVNLLSSVVSYVGDGIPMILFCKDGLIDFYKKIGFKVFSYSRLPNNINIMYRFKNELKDLIINRII
jgi:predicted GNAT family N-acyltransferase